MSLPVREVTFFKHLNFYYGLAVTEQGLQQVCLEYVDLVSLKNSFLNHTSFENQWLDQGKESRHLKKTIKQFQNYLQGEKYDFSSISLDLNTCTPFQLKVYGALREISAGEIATYKELAIAIGVPGGAIAVGTAVGKNPLPIIIPCHRILPASLHLGQFTANRGPLTKRSLLALEGVRFDANGKLLQ